MDMDMVIAMIINKNLRLFNSYLGYSMMDKLLTIVKSC